MGEREVEQTYKRGNDTKECHARNTDRKHWKTRKTRVVALKGDSRRWQSQPPKIRKQVIDKANKTRSLNQYIQPNPPNTVKQQ